MGLAANCDIFVTAYDMLGLVPNIRYRSDPIISWYFFWSWILLWILLIKFSYFPFISHHFIIFHYFSLFYSTSSPFKIWLVWSRQTFLVTCLIRQIKKTLHFGNTRHAHISIMQVPEITKTPENIEITKTCQNEVLIKMNTNMQECL